MPWFHERSSNKFFLPHMKMTSDWCLRAKSTFHQNFITLFHQVKRLRKKRHLKSCDRGSCEWAGNEKGLLPAAVPTALTQGSCLRKDSHCSGVSITRERNEFFTAAPHPGNTARAHGLGCQWEQSMSHCYFSMYPLLLLAVLGIHSFFLCILTYKKILWSACIKHLTIHIQIVLP